jgi:Hemagglutinin repeat
VTGNYSHNRSQGENSTAAAVNAGGNLNITTAGDLTVLGGSLRGKTVDVAVGGDLTLESVQDWQRSRSLTVSGGVTIGPNGIPLPSSAGYGQTSGRSQTTDAIAEIVGDKRVTVTVGGAANLVGATILSQTTDGSQNTGLTFTAASLTTRDLRDYTRQTGFNLGVTGLNNVINGMTSPPPPATGPPGEASGSGTPTPGAPTPSTPKPLTPGASSTLGGITAGYTNNASEGTTFTVIGQGTITIGGEPNPAVLGTIKRDLEGRQVMTVTDKTSFTLDLPIINAQQLAVNAANAVDFVRAITATVPPDVKAQGPASEDYYRRLIANGLSTEQAKQKLSDPYIQSQIISLENFDKARDHFGSDAAIPDTVRRLALLGLPLDFTKGEPEVTGCTGSGTTGPVLCGLIIPGQSRPAEIAETAKIKFENAVAFLGTLPGGTPTDELRRELKDSLRAYWACNDAGMGGVKQLIDQLPTQALRSQMYDQLRTEGRELIVSLASKGDHASGIQIQAEIGRADSLLASGGLVDDSRRALGFLGTVVFKGPVKTADGQGVYVTEDGAPIYYNAVAGRYFAYDPRNPDTYIGELLNLSTLAIGGSIRVVNAGAVTIGSGPVFTRSGRLGEVLGSIEGLTVAERKAVDELRSFGRKVEIVPTGNARTPDFIIDGVATEWKTVSNIVRTDTDGLSSAIFRSITDARNQSGHIIIDARGQPGMTLEIADRSIGRAYGLQKPELAPIQSITILTSQGIRYVTPSPRK